jgi:hypothetical protein
MLEKSLTQLRKLTDNRWQAHMLTTGGIWHCSATSGSYTGSPEHRDTCSTRKCLWPQQQPYHVQMMGLILNKTEVMKCAKGALPHGLLLLSSVTARSWGVGIVSLIEERSLLSQHAP